MKKHFYFYHRLSGDLEVPEELFNSLIEHLCHPDNKGYCRYKLHTAFDDSEPNVIYFYVWHRNADFLYIGYTSME